MRGDKCCDSLAELGAVCGIEEGAEAWRRGNKSSEERQPPGRKASGGLSLFAYSGEFARF